MATTMAKNSGRSRRWSGAGALRSMLSRFISTITITTTRYIR